MKRRMLAGRKLITLILLVTFFIGSVRPALAVPQIKLANWSRTIAFAVGRSVPFELAGTASHLGRFSAHGEVEFLPIEGDDLLVGAGPVVFHADNGDQLVGVATWDVGAQSDGYRGARLHFSWRDAVTFSDGTTLTSTGRFATSRPTGLVVIAIIGVLIALLLPAVQS